MSSGQKPVGVILAGGLARRMGGGDKGMRLLGGRPLLEHVLARLLPQVERVVLSSNGDPARFAQWHLTVVPDGVPEPRGPLAGVLAGMLWTSKNCRGVAEIVTVPTDSPFIPHDLVSKLKDARERAGAAIAVAASGGRRHPVVALWPVRLAPQLAQALASGEQRVGGWVLAQEAATVEWPIVQYDPFLNINRPEELAEAERLLAANLQP